MAHVDRSVVSVELEGLDADERREAMFDHLMRAADLAENTARLLADDMTEEERVSVMGAARTLSRIARRVRA